MHSTCHVKSPKSYGFTSICHDMTKSFSIGCRMFLGNFFSQQGEVIGLESGRGLALK